MSCKSIACKGFFRCSETIECISERCNVKYHPPQSLPLTPGNVIQTNAKSINLYNITSGTPLNIQEYEYSNGFSNVIEQTPTIKFGGVGGVSSQFYFMNVRSVNNTLILSSDTLNYNFGGRNAVIIFYQDPINYSWYIFRCSKGYYFPTTTREYILGVPMYTSLGENNWTLNSDVFRIINNPYTGQNIDDGIDTAIQLTDTSYMFYITDIQPSADITNLLYGRKLGIQSIDCTRELYTPITTSRNGEFLYRTTEDSYETYINLEAGSLEEFAPGITVVTYLTIGNQTKFDRVYIGVTQPNEFNSIPTISYYNGSTYTTVTIVQDFTQGFNRNGFITWTIPDDWTTDSTFNAYTIQISNDTNILPKTINKIKIASELDEDPQNNLENCWMIKGNELLFSISNCLAGEPLLLASKRSEIRINPNSWIGTGNELNSPIFCSENNCFSNCTLAYFQVTKPNGCLPSTGINSVSESSTDVKKMWIVLCTLFGIAIILLFVWVVIATKYGGLFRGMF